MFHFFKKFKFCTKLARSGFVCDTRDVSTGCVFLYWMFEWEFLINLSKNTLRTTHSESLQMSHKWRENIFCFTSFEDIPRIFASSSNSCTVIINNRNEMLWQALSSSEMNEISNYFESFSRFQCLFSQWNHSSSHRIFHTLDVSAHNQQQIQIDEYFQFQITNLQSHESKLHEKQFQSTFVNTRIQ